MLLVCLVTSFSVLKILICISSDYTYEILALQWRGRFSVNNDFHFSMFPHKATHLDNSMVLFVIFFRPLQLCEHPAPTSLVCSTKKRKDMRVNKWCQNIYFCVNCLYWFTDIAYFKETQWLDIAPLCAKTLLLKTKELNTSVHTDTMVLLQNKCAF